MSSNDERPFGGAKARRVPEPKTAKMKILSCSLYKKRSTAARPWLLWLVANCTHLIHSPVHSLWGQVQTLRRAIYKALRADLKVFCLTWALTSVASIGQCDRAVTGTMATRQSLRPFAESFQSLTTDLSTGCATTVQAQGTGNKKVDKAYSRPLKNA